MPKTLPLEALRHKFGARLQEQVVMAPYTSARIGGPADALLTSRTAAELAEDAQWLWDRQVSFTLLGGGSNMLVSDKGIRGVVLLNKSKAIRFFESQQPCIWAESGTTLSNLAQRSAAKGMGGLEWAATVPGTLGGAIYGNAGAFDGDMAGSLIQADILTETGRATWSVNEMGYGYRTSLLKRENLNAIVLSAELKLQPSSKEMAQARIREFSKRRKNTQPPGASMGSMFKNPPGDYAGKLIDLAGLKGTRIGNAEISSVHGNFFINHGETKAEDVKQLITLAQKSVFVHAGIMLELEIELIGEW